MWTTRQAASNDLGNQFTFPLTLGETAAFLPIVSMLGVRVQQATWVPTAAAASRKEDAFIEPADTHSGKRVGFGPIAPQIIPAGHKKKPWTKPWTANGE